MNKRIKKKKGLWVPKPKRLKHPIQWWFEGAAVFYKGNIYTCAMPALSNAPTKYVLHMTSYFLLKGFKRMRTNKGFSDGDGFCQTFVSLVNNPYRLYPSEKSPLPSWVKQCISDGISGEKLYSRMREWCWMQGDEVRAFARSEEGRELGMLPEESYNQSV